MSRALAFLLPVVGLLLAGLFFLPAYHGVYWLHPLLFVSLTTLGSVAALGHLLRGLGAALALVAAGLGAAALLLALSIASTGYWGAAPHDYGGDYLVLLLQIRLSQAAALPGLAGGLLLGLGRGPQDG